MPSKAKLKAANPLFKSDEKSTDNQVAPNWPILTPLVPVDDLVVEEVVPNQILIIRNIFTSTLCRTLVAFLSTLPLKTTPGKPKRGEATRVNDRFQVDDADFASVLWYKTSLRTLIESYRPSSLWQGEILGLNPNIRIYRYRPGQFFDQHYDESNKLDFGSEKIKAKTSWTLLIYLTTCEGGETTFYPEPRTKKRPQPEPIAAGNEIGMALLHKHGDDCMLHEGNEVTRGEKWVLRSDIVVKQ